MKKLANNFKKCQAEWGSIRAKLFNQRLGDLLNAQTLEDVRNLPGNYHELVENRKGQWACNLDNPYRLVFTPHEDPIPTDEDGKYIWVEIKGVEIVEVTNYHGK
ncbi:MAG: killer suppression protein HigA [Bacteroidales bacterium]|jgi:proteic killer suppression protein|nr:killer suppression protein HigA [Bacteroidales bacterium]